MQYHEAANFLFDLRRFRVKPGTESIRELLAHLGDPHSEVDFVQVAGSNGKGSTARMVESVCREAGLRTGLYTSPHFDDLRERIRIDGRKMTKGAVATFVAAAKPFLVERAAAGKPLTFFEVVTAMGLWQFGRREVDLAVLEVGMGGELDATSVVSPVASAVTNVTLEHTAVLGDTVAEIATTKAAVAPDGAPLVTAATGEALDVLRREAGELLVVGETGADGDGDGDGSGGRATESEADLLVDYEGRINDQESRVTVVDDERTLSARLPLIGAYQASNAGVAVALARQVLGADTDDETVARGLRNAHWPGRFEVVEREPTVVLDGAHNPGACAELARTVDEFDVDGLHLVFAAMHDKDHAGMAAALPDADSVVTCRPAIDRAEDPEVLARVFRNDGVDDVRVVDTVADAVRDARERAAPGEFVLVTGSLFLVAEARAPYSRVTVPRTVQDRDDASRVLAGADVTAEDRERTADETVHRTVRTRVQRRQARELRAEMLDVGGACVSSGLRSGGELVEVVLSGTLAQFAALVDALDGQGLGLSGVAAELAASVGLDSPAGLDDPVDTDTDRERDGYPWADRTAVMGILNVTPDSFHDGGEYLDPGVAIDRATEMVGAGADVIDVGGESTRPGADPVTVDEEKRRVLPVVEALVDLDVTVSVDTRRAEVGEAALDAGADVLNDVTGLSDPEMRFLAAEREVPVIVMHSIDAPVVPGKDVEYDDVVEDVIAELRERVLLAEKAGIPRARVVVDPGLGFGKSKAENFELLGRLEEFRALGCPVLVGHSHKSMFELVGGDGGDDLPSTVAGSAVAAANGADLVRVHDVAENVRAVRVAEAASDPSQFGDESQD
ncbi:dihydropteroate synthase [Halobium salinum]|uniref:Probable bifunctional folylpolyglutamate synthase/dihydropteroate synthase n=1 Tax=Halobium salinum TaxID=1364940 RepID=A0ABD5PCU3_9EURY|nr:dihydropteroate synthase [Halobium salinum]